MIVGNIKRMEEVVLDGNSEQWVKDCVLENEVISPNMPLNGVSVWNIPEPIVERPGKKQKKDIVIVMKSMFI